MQLRIRPRSWLRQTTAVLVAMLLIGVASAADRTVPEVADGVVRASPLKGANQAFLPPIRKSSHAANLLSLPSGDLLCFWFTGSEEGNSGVSIAMSRLDHGSNQWSHPVILSHHPGWSDQNPVPFRAPDGRLWLFHTSQKANQGQTTAVVYQLTSEDQGHTWTAPHLLFSKPGTFIRQRLVVFHRLWLFPTYHSASAGITTNAQHDVSIVKISKDNGKTWSECKVPGSGGLVQMDILKLSDRRLVAFFRSRYADWIYKSESPDGCHWSTPLATQLPNNNSSIQAVRLKDGHVVIAFNNAHAGAIRARPRTAAREILSIALSVDGGKTWPWVRDVQKEREAPALRSEEDAEYSYPSVTQSPDGKIQMAFTFRRETVKYMTFDESWIKLGATKGLFTGDLKP
ncbi:MAG TPA: sialidase family protein [Acidobacteriaceae bacterium]|nr:sialidase family protein [Acidobacteriaceae bacterium]